MRILLILALEFAAATQQRSDTIIRVADRPRHAGVADLVEEVSIGTTSGAPEYSFTAIRAVLPMRNGSLLIMDASGGGRGTAEQWLRQYDLNGRYVRSFGRTGQGPGEYMGTPAIGELPDGKIVLHDAQQARLIVYDASGRPADFRLEDRAGASGRDIPQFHLTDTTGFVYRRVPARALSQNEAPALHPAVLARFRPGAAIVDTIHQPVFPPSPTYDRSLFSVSRPGSTISTGIVHWPNPIWRLSPLGYVVTGIPTRYAVELRVPPNRPATRAGAPPSWQPGDPVISIRRNVAPVAVSDVERAESRAWAEKWMRENADPAWTWRGPPVPTTKPAYTDVRIALDGRIWVKIAQPSVRRPATDRSGLQFGEAVPVWDVFESDGAYVGQVRTPAALTQMIMRGDNVWGALINSDGVPVVKRWRIGWR